MSVLLKLPVSIVINCLAPFLGEENRELSKIFRIPDLIYVNIEYDSKKISSGLYEIKKMQNIFVYDVNFQS